MTMTKPANVLYASFPHAVLTPEGQYAHLPPVSVGRALTLIGSEDTVHIRLRSRTISPVHAMILNADGRVVIRDLSSHTHVYVNSRLVREAVLCAGDKIRVGRIRFIFEPGQPIADGPPHAVPPAQLWNQDGKPISMKGSIFVLGRRRDADLVVSATPEPAHAIIFSIGGRHFLRHLKLSAPVHLNDREVRTSLLSPGDVIDIYGEKYQFAPFHEGASVHAGSFALPARSDVHDDAPPEFDAGLSPILAALKGPKEAPAPIGIFHPGDVSPPTEPLPAAAAALIEQTAPLEAALAPASALVSDEAAAPPPEENVVEAETSSPAPDPQQPAEQVREEVAWEPPRISSLPVAEEPAVVAHEPVIVEPEPARIEPEPAFVEPEPAAEEFAPSLADDSAAPAIAASAPTVEEPSPTIADPVRPQMGLVVSDDMLPALKEWGPLAMAMLSQGRQDVFPDEAAEVAEQTPPNRKWAWISMVAAVTLVIGIGAWLTLKGAL